MADQPRAGIELVVDREAAEQRAREGRDRLDLALAAALGASGDGGVGATLTEEDDPVRVGRALDSTEKGGEGPDQGLLEVAALLERRGDRLGDVRQHPLLLAGEQGAEKLLLARIAVVDDRLRDPGGVGDRRHRGALVAALAEQLEGAVEDQRPAPLGTEMSGSR